MKQKSVNIDLWRDEFTPYPMMGYVHKCVWDMCISGHGIWT